MQYSVMDLRDDAINAEVEVSALLRKAIAIASDLGNEDITDWLEKELKGYDYDDEDIPEYRCIHGWIEGLNPMRGWVRCQLPPGFGEALEDQRIANSIPSLELSIKEGKRVSVEYPEEIRRTFVKMYGHDTRYALVYSTSSLTNILEGVRSKIIEWTNLLISMGITGDAGQFKEEEIEKANTIVIEKNTSYSFFTVNSDKSVSVNGPVEVGGDSVIGSNSRINKHSGLMVTIVAAVIAGLILRLAFLDEILEFLNKVLQQ